MTLLGAVLAALSVFAVALAAAPRSRVAARLAAWRAPARGLRLPGLALVSESTIRASGLGITAEQLAAAKISCALVFALLAAIAAISVPLSIAVVIAAAYFGFVLPSVAIERMAARRWAEAELAIASLVEWTHALVLSGRPVEPAILALARRGAGASLVDGVLTRVADVYTLGAPIHAALLNEARAAGLPSLERVAERLQRSRELGVGSVGVLEDLRDEMRTAARDRLLRSASQVEGKMTLILTLCYLPALTLLVVIPLFMTLLAGLFG